MIENIEKSLTIKMWGQNKSFENYEKENDKLKKELQLKKKFIFKHEKVCKFR